MKSLDYCFLCNFELKYPLSPQNLPAVTKFQDTKKYKESFSAGDVFPL